MLLVREGDHDGTQTVEKAFHSARKLIVLTGAGISTSCGVSDFRSSGGLRDISVQSALESLLDALSGETASPSTIRFGSIGAICKGIPKTVLQQKTTALFDANNLRDPAYSMAFHRFIVLFKEFVDHHVLEASHFHMLIGTLKRKNRLLHWYTQNIDGLELSTGCSYYTGLIEVLNNARTYGDPPSFDVMPLHGSVTTLGCSKCDAVSSWDEAASEAFLAGKEHDCSHCPASTRTRRSLARGLLRPGIVLYNETHPYSDIIRDTASWDVKQKPDLLLIAGTSLRIPGAIDLVKTFCNKIRQTTKGTVISIGTQEPPHHVQHFLDFHLLMACDDFAALVDGDSLHKGPDGSAKPQPVDSHEAQMDRGLLATMML